MWPTLTTSSKHLTITLPLPNIFQTRPYSSPWSASLVTRSFLLGTLCFPFLQFLPPFPLFFGIINKCNIKYFNTLCYPINTRNIKKIGSYWSILMLQPNIKCLGLLILEVGSGCSCHESFVLIYSYQLIQGMSIIQKALLSGLALSYALGGKEQDPKCFIYRDDIGAFWGIHGYEEQVTEVGTHKGHISWPQFRFLGTFDSGSVRRGFQVFTRNCANCHGMIGKKYDLLLDKVYEQLELATWVGENFTIHPAHHHFKQYYYQEWDDRDRFIHDHIYPTYYSQDQAKNANGGVWPTDFTKIRLRPGGINYIYNIMTGYYFKPPYGMDVPKGKHFNPYFDHMIIGMPRQLYDGLVEYEDGTPASTPQMANDVANFIGFMQRRSGHSYPDKQVRKWMIFLGCMLLLPFRYLKTYGYYRALLSTRTEVYAVRDNLGYKHWKTGQVASKAPEYRSNYWC